MSPVQIFLVFLIVLSGTVLQGSIGFGLGPIAVPLLVLIDPAFVPGPLLLSALILTLLMSFRERRDIHYRGLAWAVPGRLLGSLAGGALLVVIPKDNLAILFASMVFLAIIINLSGIVPAPSSRNILAAGILSGVMATTSAIGGAPIALIYQKQNGPRIRSTLAAIFVFGTLISMVILSRIGLMGIKEFLLSLYLVPGILAGYILSRKTSKILDKGFIRPAVLAASALCGLAVILKSIF